MALLLREWQGNAKGTAYIGRALNLDGPVVLFDNFPRNGKPQPGALANRLGGVEGLKNPLAHVLGHSQSCVLDLYPNVVLFRTSSHRDRAMRWHGVCCIDQQIDKHLVQLLNMTNDGGQLAPLLHDVRLVLNFIGGKA